MKLKFFTVILVALALGACATFQESETETAAPTDASAVVTPVNSGFDGCCMNWIGAICAQEVTPGCSGTKTPTGAIIFNKPTSSAADLITPAF